MSACLTILLREIHSRRMLLAASAAMGVLALVAPWLASRGGANAAEIRGTAAVVVALLWTVLLAIGLGATCFARDLGENRLGFDFRLPVRATTIWAARLLGAYVVLLLAGALILGIAALAPTDLEGAAGALGLLTPWNEVDRTSMNLVLSVLGIEAPLLLGLLLLAKNVGGLALFGDRRWSALDLASVVTLAVLGFLSLDRLVGWGLSPWNGRVLLALAVTLAGGLLLASWRQLVVGRTEAARAHVQASVVLAISAIVGGSGAYWAADRIVTPQWGELDSMDSEVHLLTERLVLVGEPWGYVRFRFLHDLSSGQTLRLGPVAGSLNYPTAQVSADHSTVVWTEQRGGWGHTGPARLFRLSASSPFDSTVETAIEWTEPLVSWALSPDGRRVVSSRRRTQERAGTLIVEDLASGGVLRSFVPNGCEVPTTVRFMSPDKVSVLCRNPAQSADSPPTFREDSFDIESGVLVEQGPEISGRALFAVNPVVHQAEPGFAVDPFSGSGGERGWKIWTSTENREPKELLAPPGLDPYSSNEQVVTTAAGETVILAGPPNDTLLLIYGPDNELRFQIPISAAGQRLLRGPLEGGRSIAIAHTAALVSYPWDRVWDVEHVDLQNGEKKRLASSGSWINSPPDTRSTLLLFLSKRGWQWLDPESGQMKALFRQNS